MKNVQNEILILGIDIGDRTFSADAVKLKRDIIVPVALPGQQGNLPILSAVVRTKDGQYVLIRDEQEMDSSKLSEVLVNFKVRPSSVPADSPRGIAYRQGVFKMLELTLTREPTLQTIRDLAGGCEKIVINVGYPTNWNDLDVGIFRTILEDSVLGDREALAELFGRPAEFTLERESTAALIYARSHQKELGIGRKTNVLALDFGSSTVNVTALTVEGRCTLYNSGHNFFGGRMADCLIADYYLSQLSEKELLHFEDLNRLNGGVAFSLLMMAACRAKEALTRQTSARIITDIFPDKAVRFTRRDFDRCLDKPLEPIARRFSLLPAPGKIEPDMRFGSRSWRQILTDYLTSEKEKLAGIGFAPEAVIVTGGGSLLPETQKICNNLFKNVSFMNADNASSVISRGLALSGKREIMSRDFNRQVDQFLDGKLPGIIETRVPSLADSVSGAMADMMCSQVIVPEILMWRDGRPGYDTLDDATRSISAICARSEFTESIQQDKNISSSICTWCTDDLGPAIALGMDGICKKYGVEGFELEDLNILKSADIEIDGVSAVGIDIILGVLGAIVSLVSGLLAAMISPIAVTLVLAFISVFMPSLALAIAEFIVMIPGGPVILAVVAGVAVFRLIIEGWEAFKDTIAKKLSSAHIPEWIRSMIPDNLITNSIRKNRSSILFKIKENITGEGNTASLSRQIHETIRRQVEAKLNEIRYALEQGV